MQNLASENSPIGTIIQIGENTPEERSNARFFNKYLFQYFEEISSGTIGWNLSFDSWLDMFKGWKALEWNKYEKVKSFIDLE